jgi:tetratricopeptide (TPR) repeat protein
MLNTEKSIYHIKKAITLLDYSESRIKQKAALKQLSLLYISIQDFNAAIVYLFKCLKYYEENSLSANNIKCAILLCLVNKELYKKALDFSKGIALDATDTFWKAVFSYSVALSNLKLRNLEIIEDDLINSINFIENINPRHHKQLYLKSLSNAYTAISEFYSNQENYEKAYKFLSKANNLLYTNLN